ncbi:MAG: integrase core domain-containing protein, partial [Candidatus Omnitrophica bacterium]|nr:integrase core domain-containing protein [Candidatus Omnitrophota bacterium]
MNSYAENWVGTIKRECLNNFIVFGERHLRYLISEYVKHYNETRPHSAMNNMPLEEIGVNDRETIFVLNKIDAVEDPGIVRQLARRFEPVAAVSAMTGQGIDKLRSLLDRWLSQRVRHMYFRLPATEKSAIERIMKSGAVLSSICDKGDVLIEARIDQNIAHNLSRFAVPAFYTDK